jgi:peroxiredoxin
MPKISINLPAPDFSLPTYDGQAFQLGEYFGKNKILLIFNRGFA